MKEIDRELKDIVNALKIYSDADRCNKILLFDQCIDFVAPIEFFKLTGLNKRDLLPTLLERYHQYRLKQDE